jgi:hypothetical protein
MTLKEKFNDLVPKEFGGMQEPLLSNCEIIADEFAIEFAIFSKDYSYHSSFKVWVDSFNLLGERFTSQQLKAKFKKEKGL